VVREHTARLPSTEQDWLLFGPLADVLAGARELSPEPGPARMAVG
jgi:hypothetical protein